MIRKLYIGAVFILVHLFYQCDDVFIPIVDCEECYSDKPSEGEVKLVFSEDNLKNGVPFTLYEGNIEENNVLLKDTAYTTSVSIWLKTETYYSVKANYINEDDKAIIVINGSDYDLNRIVEDCGLTCWVYVNDIINVSLSY